MKNITKVLICITFALFAHNSFSEEEENSENTVTPKMNKPQS